MLITNLLGSLGLKSITMSYTTAHSEPLSDGDLC